MLRNVLLSPGCRVGGREGAEGKEREGKALAKWEKIPQNWGGKIPEVGRPGDRVGRIGGLSARIIQRFDGLRAKSSKKAGGGKKIKLQKKKIMLRR